MNRRRFGYFCLLASAFSLLTSSVFLSCKDPYGYEPYDPNKPDPPAAPLLTEPEDGKLIVNYAYPQDVALKWERVTGASYYQVEVYRDSAASADSMEQPLISGIYSNQTSVTCGRWGDYYWRVRAYSPNWKWYTGWSELWQFWLPHPGAP